MTMTTRVLPAIAAVAVCAATTMTASAGNLLTNGDFEDFVGPFVGLSPLPSNGPITTSPATWNKWLVWERFQGVDISSLISPVPAGWSGDNFAQHSQYLTAGTGDDTDYTDQLKQGIDGSKVKPDVPVKLSFKYINTEPGRLVRVEVYGIDADDSWSEFASWACSGCTLLYTADMPLDYSSGQGWKSFTGSFTPAASYTAVAIGIQTGGNVGYARGVDDVVMIQDIAVPVDVKPGSCPNPVNVRAKGVLPVAILGTDELDVTTIDPMSLKLEGVSPLRASLEDVATPYAPYTDKPLDAYACTQYGPDGYYDLVLHFDTQDVAAAIGSVSGGAVIKLQLTGSLDAAYSGTPIVGEDVVKIIAE